MKSLLSHRRFSSSSQFQKGRLTLTKLRDKATIDETIEQVNLVFPDQYGRLNGLKLNAEYFLEMVGEGSGKPLFEYRYNPFRFDSNGTLIDFERKDQEEE